MTNRNPRFRVQRRVRGPWRKFLDSLEPERSGLHRYCYGLTGNVWDAEDLVQDTLLRVFGQLGKVDANIANPRAYLVRTATHLWIDRVRRDKLERTYVESQSWQTKSAAAKPVDGLEVREAVETMIDVLAPQERAAVLLKDVFDLSLEETASILKTSVGAVKSALHRARGRLKNEAGTDNRNTPPPELVEKYMDALSNRNATLLHEICLPDLTVELVGGVIAESLEGSKPFFKHAHMEFPAIGFGSNPNWTIIDYQGEPIVVGFRTLNGIEGVNEFHRIMEIDGSISAVRCYCFCPDTLRTVADELGLIALDRPYRSPSLGPVIKSIVRYANPWGRSDS